MWNEKGVSFIESLLVCSVLMTLLSFIPFIFHLQHSLCNQTLELHAAQVAYEGALIAKTTGLTEGRKWIDEVEYIWSFQNHTVCVRFSNLDGERLKCINREGEY